MHYIDLCTIYIDICTIYLNLYIPHFIFSEIILEYKNQINLSNVSL